MEILKIDELDLEGIELLPKHEKFAHLCLMQSVRRTQGITVEPELTDKIQGLAKDFGVLPQTTYQSYYLESPKITLYDGEIGKDEIIFKDEHLKLEVEYLKLIVEILLAVANKGSFDAEDTARIDEATEKLKGATDILEKIVKSFSEKSFRIFIAYLAGSGGRFSAAFPTIDTLFSLNLPIYPAADSLMPQPKFARYNYTTVEHLHDAQKIRAAFGSITQRASNGPFIDALLKFARQHLKFRKLHMHGAVGKFLSPKAAKVPEEFRAAAHNRIKITGVLVEEGGTPEYGRAGTGGVIKIPEYLMDFMAGLEQTIAELERKLILPIAKE